MQDLFWYFSLWRYPEGNRIINSNKNMLYIHSHFQIQWNKKDSNNIPTFYKPCFHQFIFICILKYCIRKGWFKQQHLKNFYNFAKRWIMFTMWKLKWNKEMETSIHIFLCLFSQNAVKICGTFTWKHPYRRVAQLVDPLSLFYTKAENFLYSVFKC